MTGLYLLAYVVTPALILGACLGCGLLVRRLSGLALHAAYVLPLGFAAVVTIAAFLTTWDATAELTGPAIAAVALVGLAVTRPWRGLSLKPEPRWAWPAAGAAAAFATVLAPAALSGRATFTGYGRIVDIATQFDFARYLATEGRVRPPERTTSFTEVVTKTLDIGYPGGAQSTHGAFSALLGVDLPWTYQALLAVTAAVMALGLYALLRDAVPSRPLRGVAAGIAAQPNVLIGYGLVGGVKEIVSASLLVLCAALLRPTAPERGVRAVLPLAVAVAGALAAFNLTIVPWLGLLLAGFFVVTLARRRGGARAVLRPARGWAAMAVLVVLLAAPTLYNGLKLIPVAAQAEGDAGTRTAISDLGNLAAPMPLRAASGVWISNDYRLPGAVMSNATTVVIAVVAVLALIGLVSAARRRDWGLLLIAGACAVALAYFSQRTGPWIQLKAIAVTSPFALALAFAGAATLRRRGRELGGRIALGTAAAWLLAAVVAGGVLAGNARAYHSITLAPTERLRDLEAIGDRFAGEGPTLYPAFEEYAEYLLRRSDVVGLVTTAGGGPLVPQYLPEAQTALPPLSFVRDVDDLADESVQRYKLIVQRRGPALSRPPSNYALVRRSRWHDVWRRVRPASTVVDHVGVPQARVPLTRAEPPPGQEAACDALVDTARSSSGDGDLRAAFVRAPELIEVGLEDGTRSPTWVPAGSGRVLLTGPGSFEKTVEDVPAGRYRVWLAGPFQRELRLSVDGEQVAARDAAWSYPDQWTLMTTVRLDGGEPTLRLERSGGNLLPGDGAADQPIGPLVLERMEPSAGTVQTAPADRVDDLCENRDELDWIELVRARG